VAAAVVAPTAEAVPAAAGMITLRRETTTPTGRTSYQEVFELGGGPTTTALEFGYRIHLRPGSGVTRLAYIILGEVY